MDHGLICAWLQLPSEEWPPDHYTLLGLKPREDDVGVIEQQVHTRMETVRRYQLLHPEPATEAMNRLAQALVCLTDPAAKKAYDATLFGALPTAPTPPPAPPPTPAASRPATDPLAWLFGPWGGASGDHVPVAPAPTITDWEVEPPPQRRRSEPETVPVPANSPEATQEIPTLPEHAAVEVPAAFSSPAPERAKRTHEMARLSDASRRGLGTKRALYYRIARARQLLWAWEQAGTYLSNPKRNLKRPAQATELIGHMETIRELLRNFPPLLGEAGQPGYLVLSLARQQMIVPTFQTLLPSQREALARDWQAGHDLLTAHRRFLRDELHSLRHRNRWVQAVRSFMAGLSDHSGLVFLALGLVALNLAFQELRELWLRQAVALSILAVVRLTWWWVSLRPTPVQRPRPTPPAKRPARTRPGVQSQPRTTGT
jgi:hypothetical protein